MTRVGDIAEKVRSKNAGPFWLTIDVFCGTKEAFQRISKGLESSSVAKKFSINVDDLKRFDIQQLNAIKLSLPRPAVQGTQIDRDMHGASFAQIISNIEI